MECDEFLEGYSSYRDGRLPPEREERFREHRDACSSCARYDRVVARGTEVLRELPRPEPSPDFLARLRHRIYHLEDGIPLESAQGGSVAVVAVAAVGLLAFAWLPFATQVPVEVELPAVAVEGPERPARAEPAQGAGTADLPRFLGPDLLVGQSPGEGAADWYAGGLEASTTGDRRLTPPPPGPGASFLAATGAEGPLGR